MIDLATKDEIVHVRREAVTALHRFSHDDTKAALRKVIASESSYKVVAEALRSLLKVDREHCKVDLEAALGIPSYRDEIFRDYVGYTVSSQPGDARLSRPDPSTEL